jgi:hypothetical protein
LKPALGNSSQDPILKKIITKKGWWQGVGPEFKLQDRKKKFWTGMMVHFCNPIYSGGRDRRIEFEVSPGKNS